VASSHLNTVLNRMEKIHPLVTGASVTCDQDVEMIDQRVADKMRDHLTRQDIVVRDSETGAAKSVEEGKEAFFAMIAQDMLSLSEKFDKDIDEVHKIFYQLSCNRDKLVKFLNGDKVPTLWSELEDLALKESGGKMYDHVL